MKSLKEQKRIENNELNIGDIVTLTEESLDNESHWYYSQYYGNIGIVVDISPTTHDVAIEWREYGHSAWYEQRHLRVIHKFNWGDYEKEQNTEKN